MSLPHDYASDLAGIKAPVLLIHGRYDRMMPFEVSIAILTIGRPFEKPAEWTAHALAFPKSH